MGAWSLHPVQIDIAKKVFSPDPEEVKFAKKVIEAIPDGRGVHMIDGKMQDDATWKQCKVMVTLAEHAGREGPGAGQGVRALGGNVEHQIFNPWTWQDQAGFVQAHAVSGGERTIYCAGQCSVDADGNPLHDGDMAAQIGQALDNVETVLRESGCGLSDVVRLNYYVTDVEAFLASMEGAGRRLGEAGCRPASTLLQVSRLAIPPLMVEIEATAVVDALLRVRVPQDRRAGRHPGDQVRLRDLGRGGQGRGSRDRRADGDQVAGAHAAAG